MNSARSDRVSKKSNITDVFGNLKHQSSNSFGMWKKLLKSENSQNEIVTDSESPGFFHRNDRAPESLLEKYKIFSCATMHKQLYGRL